jgi:hypothetical protein
MIAAMLTLVVVALLMVVALMFAAEVGWLIAQRPLQLKRIASGLSGAPRIAQSGKPSQRVTAIDPVMHQEAFDEGVHLVLRDRRSETLKRGLRSVP